MLLRKTQKVFWTAHQMNKEMKELFMQHALVGLLGLQPKPLKIHYI